MNRTTLVVCVLSCCVSSLFAQSNIQAFHRCGQTFVTWSEDAQAVQYKVYRHTQPITNQNYQQAQVLTTIGQGSGRHVTEEWRNNSGGFLRIQERFILNDLGAELALGTGLLPYTTQNGESGNAFYAVTSLRIGSVEVIDFQLGINSLSAPMVESVEEPCPVRVYRSPDGLTEVFTQFVDIKKWNISFDGFAYNYAVMKPQGYNPAVSYPVAVELHCWGCRYHPKAWGGSPYAGAITIMPDDPGRSWWYGFSKTHQYRNQWPDQTPYLLPVAATSGPIVNYTEQRVLRTIDEVRKNSQYHVDDNRIYCWGNSMGGSGTLTMAMRYPNVFAAGYCSLPATNYQASAWAADCAIKWGVPSAQLPIENDGKYANHLIRYNGQPAFTWQNAQKQLRDRQADEMAYLCTAHGDQDNVIEWGTQGAPWYPILENEARRGGSGWTQPNWPHDWLSWRGTGANWGWLTGLGDQFKFRKNESFPAFSNFSGNSYTNHNLNIEWASPANSLFPGVVIDTYDTWEIALKLIQLPDFYSTFNQNYTTASVDITPRRLQEFQVLPGGSYSFKHIRESDGAILAQGNLTPDGYGLLTVPNVQLSFEATRLSITPIAAAPICSSPTALSAIANGQTTALARWQPSGISTGFLVQYKTLSALSWESLPSIGSTLDLSALEPCNSYQLRVQQTCANGLQSDFTSPVTFTTQCPAAPCLSPAAVSVVSVTTDQFELAWMQQANEERYHVQFRPINSQVWETKTVLTPSVTAANLLPCTQYVIRIQSECGTGMYSDFLLMDSLVTECPTVPCLAPNDLILSQLDSSSAQLSWQADLAHIAWNVLVQEFDTNTWDTILAQVNPQVSLTGLKPCTRYLVKIAGQCSNGWSDFGNVSEFMTSCPPEVCTSPQNLILTDSDATSLSLAWAPIDSAVNYTISYKLDSSMNWTSIDANTPSVAIVGLLACTAYQIQVACLCQNGLMSAFGPVLSAQTTGCVLSVETTGVLPDVQVYPNPTTGQSLFLILNREFGPQPIVIKVLTVLGDELYKTEVSNAFGPIQLHLPQLPSGAFQIQVLRDTQLQTAWFYIVKP